MATQAQAEAQGVQGFFTGRPRPPVGLGGRTLSHRTSELGENWNKDSAHCPTLFTGPTCKKPKVTCSEHARVSPLLVFLPFDTKTPTDTAHRRAVVGLSGSCGAPAIGKVSRCELKRRSSASKECALGRFEVRCAINTEYAGAPVGGLLTWVARWGPQSLPECLGSPFKGPLTLHRGMFADLASAKRFGITSKADLDRLPEFDFVGASKQAGTRGGGQE
eukprot:140711-Prorocentrum_minimum.AAC.1